MSKCKFSVIVPSRNGCDTLIKYLPRIIEEVLKGSGELIVVDDCSEDSTKQKIVELFPSVRLLSRLENPGFCYAVNYGMSKAKSNYLLVLNSDTIPSDNSFTDLFEQLRDSDSDVAVVVPRILRPDGSDDSLFCWDFRHGLAVTGESISENSYPSGACAMWRKDSWEALEGLCSIYAPIYWEDADLGVRMKKAGLKMKRCADILVEHDHAVTLGFSLATETLRERNRFIFMDANCNSLNERMRTLFWLPLHITSALLKGNKAFLAGCFNYIKWRLNA